MIAEATSVAELDYDPIRERRDRAVAALSSFGLVSAEVFSPIRHEVEGIVGFGVRLVRVSRVIVVSACGYERTVTRLIVGGYTPLGDRVIDPSIQVIDSEHGLRNAMSDTARERLWGMCQNRYNPAYVRPGEGSKYTRDIHEVLVADGRDQGMPVRDVYRPVGEPPVTGVREFDAVATTQSRPERSTASLAA